MATAIIMRSLRRISRLSAPNPHLPLRRHAPTIALSPHRHIVVRMPPPAHPHFTFLCRASHASLHNYAASDDETPPPSPSDDVKPPPPPSDDVKPPEVKPSDDVKPPPSPSDDVKPPVVKPSDDVKPPEVKPSDDVKLPELTPSDDVKLPELTPSDDVKLPEVTPSDYVKLPEVTPDDVGPSLLEKMIKVMTELTVVDLIRRFELAFALSLLSYVVYTWMWPPLRPYVEPYWEGIKKNEIFLKVVEKLRLGDVLESTKGRIEALEKKMLELEARVEKLEAGKEMHEK